MHMLHARAGLPGSVEVVRGIAMGGFDAAKAAIRDGRAPAQDFKCAREPDMIGCCALTRCI